MGGRCVLEFCPSYLFLPFGLFRETWIFLQQKLLKISKLFCGGRGGGIQFFHFIFLLVGSIVAGMPSFSFLESVILTIPVGWVGGWVLGWVAGWGGWSEN